MKAGCSMEDKMGRDGRTSIGRIVGPDGSVLTIADLPPPGIKRWVIRRKAEVVAAVEGGLLSLGDACERYNLTIEEFAGWQHAIHKFGMDGLRATHAQQYRETVRH